MIKYSNILKNSRAFNKILLDIQENKLSHAYMIQSADNLALEEFLKLFGCGVFCQFGVCEECADCQKVINNNHSDIIHIKTEKNIGVKDVEYLIDESIKKSFEGKNKLIFIHDAQKMNKISQNKLLKVLEEPPKNVTIVMTVTNISAMLQTIRSRVQIINLDIFSTNEIYNELIKIAQDEKQAQIASICSEGLIGKAEQLLFDEDYLSLYDYAIGLLKNLTHSSQVVNFIDSEMFKKENISKFLDVLLLVLRDVAIVSKNENLVLSQHRMEEIKNLSKKYSTASAIGIMDKIEKIKKKIYYNVNSSNAGEQLMFAILEVKYKCN